VYFERVSEHAFCPNNFCAFQWAGAPQRLVEVRANWKPLRRDARPRLTYQDARQQAADFALRWPDVKSASVLEPDANMVERGQLAEVRYDQAGVVRTLYQVEVRLEYRGRESGPQSVDGDADRYPTDVPMYVDAETGACFGHTPPYTWPQAGLNDRIDLAVSVAGVPRGVECLYEPRVIDAEAYLCARYLDSLIWSGKYQPGPDGGFIAEFAGDRWSGCVGEKTLWHNDEKVHFRHPPVVVEDEVFLPAEMLERLTGWRGRFLGRPVPGSTFLMFPPG